MSIKIITESELVEAMRKQIDELDAEDLCVLAEHMFGGTYWVQDFMSTGKEYIFELRTNDEYMGAFGEVEENS